MQQQNDIKIYNPLYKETMDLTRKKERIVGRRRRQAP
jgi:hypothetical protein